MRIFQNGPALVTIGICSLLILPMLVQDGMFMDAVMYSSVGRNLADGLGSFWYPYFTEAHMATPTFHENPPLGYYLMSIFYRVLGSDIHTERIYTGLSFLITAILIVKFWKMIWPTNYKMAWLPVLLWAITTGVQWSFQNNMMENTMGPFVLGSIMAAYRAFQTDKRNLYWSAWAGLLAVSAFMVKGMPGLFVWITPVALALSQRGKFLKATKETIAMVAVAAFFGLIFYLYEPARESLETYLFERTANRLNEGATTESRYFILRVLAENLAIPGILTFITGLIVTRLNSEKMQWDSTITFLVIVGIAGSLPFVATFVQRGFYLVPVYPIFALAFASILRPTIEATTSRWRRSKYLQLAGWILIVVSLTVTGFMWGTPKRDADVIADVCYLDDQLDDRLVLRTSKALNTNWVFKSYLERYARLAISDRPDAQDSELAILPKGQSLEGYEMNEEWSDQLITVDVWVRR